MSNSSSMSKSSNKSSSRSSRASSKPSHASSKRSSQASGWTSKLKKKLGCLVPSFCTLGHHHVLMMVLLISLILLALLLAGCSSSSTLIPNIFLLALAYQKSTPTPDPAQVDYSAHTAISNIVCDARIQVRVGYFGLCVNTDGSGASWLCSNNATSLARHISSDQDPLNLIWVASRFKDTLVISYLLIAAIVLAVLCVFLLASFPAWYNDDGEESDDEEGQVKRKRFPRRVVCQAALGVVLLASTFVFISVLWQHTAALAASTVARDFANGSVTSGTGTAALVLGCNIWAMLVGVGSGLLVMVLSKRGLPSI